MSKKIDNFIKKEMALLKGDSGELGSFRLELEKDTKPKIGLEKPDDEHPMGKYC